MTLTGLRATRAAIRAAIRAAALAVALAAAALGAGCDVTTSACRDGGCFVNLDGDGDGTTVRIGTHGDVRVVRVQLRRVADGRATVELDGSPATLAPGGTAAVAGLRVECRRLDGDEVELFLRR